MKNEVIALALQAQIQIIKKAKRWSKKTISELAMKKLVILGIYRKMNTQWILMAHLIIRLKRLNIKTFSH